MHYTPEEVAKLLANRPNQPHYIAGLIAECIAAERERCAKLPALPKPRVLASGAIAGKRIELRGWHTDDIEIWERQHGLKFGA